MCVFLCFFFYSIRRTPGTTRTYTLFPYTTLFRFGMFSRATEGKTGQLVARAPRPPDASSAWEWRRACMAALTAARGPMSFFRPRHRNRPARPEPLPLAEIGRAHV